MTIMTGTLASPITVVAQPIYFEDSDIVFDSSFVWEIKESVGDLTDEEVQVIEKKLDAENEEPKITFGSAQEAIDFLRSRIKRPHA